MARCRWIELEGQRRGLRGRSDDDGIKARVDIGIGCRRGQGGEHRSTGKNRGQTKTKGIALQDGISLIQSAQLTMRGGGFGCDRRSQGCASRLLRKLQGDTRRDNVTQARIATVSALC